MITLHQWQCLSADQQKNYINCYDFGGKLNRAEAIKLSLNVPLFTMFLEEAHKASEKTDHHSARAIIYYLRHQTLVGDNDIDFKINNNISPLLSRASMEMFPALNNFFETRSPTFKQEN